MRSLYRCIKKYAKDTNNFSMKYLNSGGNDTDAEYIGTIAEFEGPFIEKMIKFYKKNMVVRDHINQYRSVEETIEEYTMHDDMVLPGIETAPMKNMSSKIKRIVGVRKPLSPPFIGSSGRKLNKIRGRGKIVGIFLNKYGDDVTNLTDILPSSYDIPEKRRPIRNTIDRIGNYIVDIISRD